MYKLNCRRCQGHTEDCCGSTADSVEIINGLLIQKEDDSIVGKLYNPISIRQNGTSVILTDSRENVFELDLSDTVYTNTDDLIQYLTDCQCPQGGDNGDLAVTFNENTRVLTVTHGTDSDTTIIPGGGVAIEEDFIELTDADITTAGSPTDADVVNYVNANDVESTHLYYIGGGSLENPDYIWAVDSQDGGDGVLEIIAIRKPFSASGWRNYLMNATAGQEVIAVTEGIIDTTIIRNSVGVATVSIPEDTEKIEMVLPVEYIGKDDNNNVTVHFDFAGNRVYNRSETTLRYPSVEYYNRDGELFSSFDIQDEGGTPQRRFLPYSQDGRVSLQVSAVDAAQIYSIRAKF